MYATAVVGAALLAIGAYRLFRGRSTAHGVRSEAGEQSAGSTQAGGPEVVSDVEGGGRSVGSAGIGPDGEPDWVNPTGQPPRGCDAYGCGHFGAPRIRGGTIGVHQGVDYRATPGQNVRAPAGGRIVRTVDAVYPNPPHMSGVVLETPSGYRVKIFYVEPDRSLVGAMVGPGRTIGTSQDLSLRYPPIPGRGVMTNHVHIEIQSLQGELVNPRVLIP